eukprot:m.76391 g.76391  ORF g.76391 m.76391 type:complete len:330 (-) comp11879_c0_seq1:3069-4058(-)
MVHSVEQNRLVQLRIPSEKMEEKNVVFAGVEGGGTSWRVAIAVGDPTNIVEEVEFKTEDPDVTIGKVKNFLSKHHYDALGVATFGPIQPTRGKDKFGYITSTPKPGWEDTDVMGKLVDESNENVPFLFDTDVNAPAVAEFEYFGKPKGHNSCAYITVGTGVGVGLVINGRPVHGLLHPEGGHLMLQFHEDDLPEGFKGTCPFHTNCVEGLVSAAALARFADKKTADELPSLPDTHPVWDHAADVLASLCSSLLLLVSPERIVLSGGVMKREGLLEKIHTRTLGKLNKYIQNETLLKTPADIIQRSHWRNNSGIIGSLSLARRAFEQQQQ